MAVLRTFNQVTISGCPLKKCLVVRTWNKVLVYMYKGEFWLQLYDCPLDNCISIFGCLATYLVALGAWTTKILNDGCD